MPNGEDAMPVSDEGEYGALSDLPLGIPSWTRHTGLDPMDYFYYSLLRDESWSDWQRFILFEKTVIPLGSARRILYLVSVGYTEKQPLSRSSGPPPEESASYAQALRFLAYNPHPKQLGFLRMGAPDPDYSRWNLFSVLTEEEGLFSGRPWSWDNFLPRLFTVSSMLLGGLLVIEALRFILKAGTRVGRGGGRGGADYEEGP
ncbi:hypothetical protein AAU61_12910 [Desulfocarbo indianensis]|nr:hypothetical protein AAU61_12910 [Desulfocarbo indianensis]